LFLKIWRAWNWEIIACTFKLDALTVGLRDYIYVVGRLEGITVGEIVGTCEGDRLGD